MALRAAIHGAQHAHDDGLHLTFSSTDSELARTSHHIGYPGRTLLLPRSLILVH